MALGIAGAEGHEKDAGGAFGRDAVGYRLAQASDCRASPSAVPTLFPSGEAINQMCDAP
jgi:hypothetical protein